MVYQLWLVSLLQRFALQEEYTNGQMILALSASNDGLTSTQLSHSVESTSCYLKHAPGTNALIK
jgi:hypothetical protein